MTFDVNKKTWNTDISYLLNGDLVESCVYKKKQEQQRYLLYNAKYS